VPALAELMADMASGLRDQELAIVRGPRNTLPVLAGLEWTPYPVDDPFAAATMPHAFRTLLGVCLTLASASTFTFPEEYLSFYMDGTNQEGVQKPRDP
jgi:hypothetical protein